ncbi:MAG: hypothetical protein IT178_19190 [Acidobacteria bacterium]|nr:hypothetical protein [Acidobacteriota bacterium]
MTRALPIVAVLALSLGGSALRAQPALDDLLQRASRYVTDYERQFWLLALDEEYVQWLERPVNPGSNLSRSNPGGGMMSGGAQIRRIIISADYLLVQGGEGRGWSPFRDVISVNGNTARDRDDRLVRLFRGGAENAYELADGLHAESRRHDLGNVQRTINIPMLGMMLLHPRVVERFSFKPDGDEVIGGRYVERLSFRERTRPTLIKTLRGKDLALTGRLWIEPSTGVIIRTETIAADPIVRAQVTVTFRRDGELAMWVPEKMEEFYKAQLSIDDIFSTSTFSAPRIFQPGSK